LEEIMAQVAAFFSTVNVLLLIGLIWIYASSFRKVRAQFTAGLLFFATLFLVQNLISLYSFLTMFMYYAPGVTGIVLAITIVQTAGLGVILWTGLR
jgi:predicted membrane protein